MWLHCDSVCEEGVQEGTVSLAPLCASFQSLPRLPTIKLGPSGADSWMGGFVYILGPCGSLQWTLLWAWEFLLLPQPPHMFLVRGFKALFPRTGILGCAVCLTPQLFLPFYLHAHVGLPGLPATTLPTPVLQPLPCRKSSPPGCQSLPLLPVWMNVSSLTPWLSDFHTIQFSVGSCWFLYLNLLLSFLWFCEEAQCVYLHLHLGWNSKFLSWMYSHFCFDYLCLGVISQKSLSNPISWIFLMFSSRCFLVLSFTCSSLIHFELSFVYGIRWGSNFIPLHMVNQFYQHHLLRIQPFPLLSGLSF